MENLYSFLTSISQIARISQSMSLGQNAKITYKGIFVIVSALIFTFSCEVTLIGYIHVIFLILFYANLQKMIILEKACPWDKNCHFSFPDIKIQHFTKKKYYLGLILVARFMSRKKLLYYFINFRNKLVFGQPCPWDILA